MIVAVVLFVLLLSVLKGGGSSTPTRSLTSASSRSERATHRSRAQEPAASNPGEVVVTVLNGTNTTGLAHHLAANLQADGYTHAEASTAVPPGEHPTTVVEYTSGHHADAEGVAKALSVSQVQPIEGSTASLATSAAVVVVAGADQAAVLGGGGTSGNGEPAASGEAPAGEAPAGEAPASEAPASEAPAGGGTPGGAGEAPAGATPGGAEESAAPTGG